MRYSSRIDLNACGALGQHGQQLAYPATEIDRRAQAISANVPQVKSSYHLTPATSIPQVRQIFIIIRCLPGCHPWFKSIRQIP